MAYYGNQPTVGQNQSFKVLDDISSYTETFDATSTTVVSAANDTLTFYDHRFVQGQRVTYTHGGGAVINGLTTATAYYVIRQDKDTIQLATNATNAANGTAIDISLSGTSGTAHTLNIAFDGTNTKFKATYESGYHVKLTRAAQLQISVNGVVQEPKDGNSPSSGFGIDTNNVIVFATAPISTDTFWGTFLASNLPSWEIADNKVDNFDGDSSATNFTLSKLPANNENVLVTINGVVQHPSDATTTRAYKLIGQEIVFTSAPLTGEAIQVRHIGFAGAAAGGVTGFYGRTGNVTLTSSDDVTINNITGVAATFTGNVSIGGTLTYTDVTNIDAVGIITAQQGIHVGAGATVAILNTTTGISSFTKLNVIGRVGIGTTNPATDLQLAGTDANLQFRVTKEGVGSFNHGVDSDGAFLETLSGDNIPIRFYAGGGEKIRLTTTGKVGIGLTNPSEKLDVNGTIQCLNELRSTSGNDLLLNAGSANRDVKIQVNDVNMLYVKGDTGNIGIGTDVPATEFHVYDGNSLLVSLFESETHDSRLRIKAPDNKYSQLEFSDSDADTGEIRYDHTNDSMQFFVNSNSEKLRINRDGDVLIGTGTTPTADIKLLVSGNGGVSSGSYFSFRADYGNVPEPAAHAIKYDSTIGAGGGLHCYSYSGMNFNLGGQERIKFDVNGKVLIGVGVTDYGSLNVDGAASFGDNGTNAGIIIGTDGVSGAALHCLTTGSFQNGSYSNMRFNALSHKFTYGNTVRMFIESDGKIGIGTDDPDHNLHLWKYGGDSVLSIESQGNGNHSAIEFIRTSSGGDSKGAGSIYVTGDTSGSEAKMQFGVGHNIGHGTLPRMTIMGNGEVGIGTDNPLCGDLQVGATEGGLLGSVFTTTPLVAIAPGNLGGTQFDDHKIAIFGGQTTGNCSGLSVYHYRRNTGTNWTTDGFSLRQEVDNTSNIYDYINFAQGKVGIGTNIPVSALDVRNNSGTDPLLSLHHSDADVIGEVIRIGRVTPYHTIRYHSIKAEHSGGAGSNFLGFNLHNGSTTTSQTEVLRLIGNGEVKCSNGISYGPNSGHSNDEVMRMHMYSDSSTINDGVTFKVTLTFANANTGPFMIELFQAHVHYPGTPSYCKVIGAYGASDPTGGVSSHIVENSGNIGSLTITNTSDATQRGNNSDWTFSIQGTSASSNVGTSLKVMTYVIVHSRTIPAGCTFEEV